jgi:6-phospho-beta-glucosidase
VKAERVRIAVVGGGVSIVRLGELLAAAPGLPPLHLVLTARRPERTAALVRHLAARIAPPRPEWAVTSAPSLAAAVDGARIVILLVRVGGLAARAWDEAFPARFGLVGDEGVGLGGMANAWRTVPVVRDIAATLRRSAPDARVLNLMAPLGITTRTLWDVGVPAPGLCELPLTTRARLREVLPAEECASLRYAGLNHLGWFWNGGPSGAAALRPAVEAGLADGATLARFGALPLRYWYEVFDPDAARRLGVSRAPGRAARLEDLGERVLARLRAAPGTDVPELRERPTPWFEHALVPAVAALLGGAPFEGFANLPNDGRVAGLPDDLVVEVPATVDAGGVHTGAPVRPPDPVLRVLSAVGAADLRAGAAARDRSVAGLRAAIAALPLPLPAGQVALAAAVAIAPIPDRLRTVPEPA